MRTERKRRRTRRSTRQKIYFAVLIAAIILGGGYIERGWVDVPGALAMLALGIPMIMTWIWTENETRPGGRARR